jgi:hypothetical protein
MTCHTQCKHYPLHHISGYYQVEWKMSFITKIRKYGKYNLHAVVMSDVDNK